MARQVVLDEGMRTTVLASTYSSDDLEYVVVLAGLGE
jgi:hypothetical protein